MARDLNSFFRLSGKLDLPAYPGFIVMKIAMSGFTLTCFPTSSTLIVAAETNDYLVNKQNHMVSNKIYFE